MNKTAKISIIAIFVILIVISSYFSGLFSVVSSTRKDFRQQVTCGKSSVFQFDTLRVDYTTQAISSRILDPESDFKTDCVPIYVKVMEKNIVLFEYDQANGGVKVDAMTTSPDYDVFINDEVRLDDKVTYYQIPNNYADGIYFTMHTKNDAISTTPFDSGKRLSGEVFDKVNALYVFDIGNNGWSSTDYTTGSELYFKVNPSMGDLDSDVEVIEDNAVMTVVSGFPTDLSYADVCMNFGVVGFAGGIQYDTVCKKESGIIKAGETMIFEFPIPDTNITTYYLRGDMMDMYMVLSQFSTTNIYASDLKNLVDGNKVAAGNLIGDVTEVTTVIEPVEEEPAPVEEIVDEVPAPKPVIEWYTYLIMGAAALIVGIVAYLRFKKN